MKQPHDPVNHPNHYLQGKIECIEALESALTREQFVGFCIGNAMKYLWRWQAKGGVQDLYKSRWYLNCIIGKLEESLAKSNEISREEFRRMLTENFDASSENRNTEKKPQ